ncbi:cytochrome c oxidase assembly protein COX18, mitochondrial isoform X2 [Amia ocellicauda]|uniref:cytochrome c oxidase assembly protein COX18, mitochondrial isoform X2 n=1 Tax=Amia ocellicauda TaxID=2972642 RepID=UPI003464620A
MAAPLWTCKNYGCLLRKWQLSKMMCGLFSLDHRNNTIKVPPRSLPVTRPLFSCSTGLAWRGVLQQRRTLVSASMLSAASVATDSPGWYESIVDSAPIHMTEELLVAVQQATGLPWWASVVCTTVALRTVITLPLGAYQMAVIAKIEALQSEIAELAKRLRYEVSVRAKQVGWSEKNARFHYRKNLRRIVSELYVRDNCHPFKASLLIWVQIPMWVFLSLALRNMSVGLTDSARVSLSEFAAGGVLWFPDLTVPDSTWIMPISVGLINLIIVESMALYWLTSSCVGLGHNLLLRSPRFRQLCRIPPTQADSQTPYRDIASAFIGKYFK